MNPRRILRLIKKELLQTRRDKRMIAMILMAPVFQLFIFGYAVTTDVKHISTAVLDQDRTAASRDFIERFIRSGYFEYKDYLNRPEEVDRLLDAGKVQIVLTIPRGFADDLSRGRSAQVQAILDGSDSMTAGIISGYAAEVVREYSAGVALSRLARLKSVVPQVPRLEGRTRVWYNPELKSVNFMVPGVLCLILLIITVNLTSAAIVKEREIGTLEQLVVTPITARELMIGKTVPFLLIGLLDMTLVLTVSVFWFHVPIAGNVFLLFALSAIFLLTSLGLGIFISTISKTQHEASLTAFFLMFPSVLLSGFMFPIANMPKVIQLITYLIPLRYFLQIIRGIFLKGNGIAQLWPQVIVLAIFGIAILTASALRFSKRLG